MVHDSGATIRGWRPAIEPRLSRFGNDMAPSRFALDNVVICPKCWRMDLGTDLGIASGGVDLVAALPGHSALVDIWL